MIEQKQLMAVGKFLKPHGVNGEITALRDFDDLDFEALRCVVVDIDGIYVPFFVESARPKGAETDLLTIDGIADEAHASRLTNKTIFALRSDLADGGMAGVGETDGDGFYAADLVGFEVVLDSGETLGKVVGVDDSTANFLLIVETPAGSNMLIPIADELVDELDPESKRIAMSLPDGLLEMQR